MTSFPRPLSGQVATDWALFADWCAATGHVALPADPTTVEQFLRSVAGARATQQRRWRHIRHVHDTNSTPLPQPDAPETDLPWRTGPGWADVPTSLSHCAAFGWPHGFHGRRDAWLVVCAGIVGMTRRQIVTVTPSSIRLSPGDDAPATVGGIPIPRGGGDPWRCPACAVVRWLQVAGLADRWGRYSVKAELVSPGPVEHVCDQPIPGYWRELWQVSVAIDRWGQLNDEPLHPRTVSAILAYRQASTADVAAGADVAALGDGFTHPEVDRTDWTDDEVFTLLDERMRAADEAVARIEEWLAGDPTMARLKGRA